MSNTDPAWRLGDEDDFVLEDDETFGLGGEPDPIRRCPR
jgi:hypothetical protein